MILIFGKKSCEHIPENPFFDFRSNKPTAQAINKPKKPAAEHCHCFVFYNQNENNISHAHIHSNSVYRHSSGNLFIINNGLFKC